MPRKPIRVVIIEEGMGNLTDKCYYTRAALESAVEKKLFEGAKCNADHQSLLEEQVQPEGSVRKIVGSYSNIALVDGDEKQAIIEADLGILDGIEYDWAESLCHRALDVTKQTGKEFIGLSINALGNTEQILLADFMKSATIPNSALPKLQLAMDEGIEEIQVCNELTEATSVDLVTRAGARGRIVKLLETEKLRMAGKNTAASAPAKKTREGDAPPPKKGDGKDGGGGGDSEGHADADQDKQLIQSMLKKALGDGDHGEEAHEAMKQAHERAMKCGYEGEAAQEAAVASMKMAHQAAKEAEEAEAEECEDGGDKSEAGNDGDPAGGADGTPPSKGKESKMERELIQLKAEVARLKERDTANTAIELRSKALRESGLRGEGLKALEKILAGKSTEKGIKDAAKTFTEAYGMGGKAADPGFIVTPEKGGDQTSGGGLSLASAVQE